MVVSARRDAKLRKDSSEGVAGAAGIAIAVWAAAECTALHAGRRTGRALPVASAVVPALILVPWLLGYGAATSLLAFLPLTVIGIACSASVPTDGESGARSTPKCTVTCRVG